MCSVCVSRVTGVQGRTCHVMGKQPIMCRHWRTVLDFFLLNFASDAQYFHNHAGQGISIMLTIMLKYIHVRVATEHATCKYLLLNHKMSTSSVKDVFGTLMIILYGDDFTNTLTLH